MCVLRLTLVFPRDLVYNLTSGLGVVVLAMDNPQKPKQTATLTTPAMQSPHESVLDNKRRGLLVRGRRAAPLSRSGDQQFDRVSIMGGVSYLHTRLGGQEEPERARALPPRTAPPTTANEPRQPQAGEFATIRCRSELTELHAVNLVADIADTAARARIVIVDLSLTARVDAAGLGALVSGAMSCRAAGSSLRIVGAHGIVAHALRFTGLSRALSTHETVDDALGGM